MTVSFNPASNVRFRANSVSESCKHENHTCPKCGQEIDDSFENTQNKTNSKKGFWGRAKDKFIGLRKALLDIGYVTMGALKGSLYGAVTAGGVAGAVALRNVIKKAPKKLGVGGKILAGVAGVAVLAGNIIKSKLDANEAKAKLDHRWETGHNE